MSDYLSVLPVELIDQILEYIPMFDICLSMCFVNKSLRSICLNSSRYKIDFSSMIPSMNKKQFDCICTFLLHSISQLVSLTLFDNDDPLTPAKNELFFSRFNCIDQTFVNLHSLKLTYITYDTSCLFKLRLSPLIVKLSIHLVHNGQSSANRLVTSDVLCEFLFYSSSLKYLSLKLSNYSEKMLIIRPSNARRLSFVQYFHLEGVIIDLSSLFALVPLLHSLEIGFIDRQWTLNPLHSPPLHLQELRLELWNIGWTKMSNLLSSFPELSRLIVIGDDLDRDMGDGFGWSRLLQKIKHFECKLKFNSDAFFNQPINLDSFRTLFWLEEKKWFVNYHECTYTGCSVLYSIADHLSHPKIAVLSSDGYQPRSFEIFCSTINYQYLNCALLHQFIYANERYGFRSDDIFPMTFRHLYYYLDSSRIVNGYNRPGWIYQSPDELAQFVRNASHLRAICVSLPLLHHLLLHQWWNIIYLRIEPDSVNNLPQLSLSSIERLVHSFPHLKRLDIHSSSISDCDLSQLLNQMKMTLTDLIIRQSMTSQWIKQNLQLKNVHYSCDMQNCVYLWF